MFKSFEMNFPAFTGREKRKITVYLPNSYPYSPKTRYPVLYMFDGHNAFFDNEATYGKSWGVGKYLNKNRVPLIVVGVDCNHAPNAARIIEYAPFDFEMPDKWKDPETDSEETEFVKGYGHETMEWFVNNLKPVIDRRFRTIRDRSGTYIMGSSMGGLMSLYALGQFNHVFSKACALSPDFECWYEQTEEWIRGLEIDPDTELFVDYGTMEEDWDEQGEAIGFYTGLLLEKGMNLTMRMVPNGTHCEASWERELPFCISMLMFREE